MSGTNQPAVRPPPKPGQGEQIWEITSNELKILILIWIN